MEPIPGVWARLTKALTGGEDVCILVNDEASQRSAEAALAAEDALSERVSFYRVATNDAWMRDHGPTFLVRRQSITAQEVLRDGPAKAWPPQHERKEPAPTVRAAGERRQSVRGRDVREGHREEVGDVAMVDWSYNSWGGKYPPWDDDDRVPARLAEMLSLPIFRPGIVLEGGSVEVNGAGTLMTTESCLLNPNRNPHLNRSDIERILSDHLAVGNFVWLGDGVDGDDTDGHIDDLARFVSPTQVVTVVEEDATDVNYRPLRDNLRRLEKSRDQDGRLLDVVTIPMPPPLIVDGQRLPASYANFYIANRCVVVPVFGCDADEVALSTIQGCFPGREVVALDAVDLVLGLGAFHCITQQQPY